jgi:hypothetical protein
MSPEAQPAEAPQESPPTDPGNVRVRRRRLNLLMRALGEIGIVTVGILIAFALEAWWDDRSMSRQEQVHLRALASDFQQNVDALKRLIALEENVAASSHELLLRAQAGESGSSEPLAKLISSVFNSARYEPVMGAYEALVNSAGLTLIRDDSLRAALAQFAARVDDHYAERWSNELYFAFAREFGGQIMLGFRTEPEAERERKFQQVLHDPRFQGHLALRYYGERDLAREYRDLLQQAEAVSTQVRKQIKD